MFALKRISSSASILLLFCCTFFFTHELEAQAPEGVNYQAVARNNAGDALANQVISVRFSIIATSTSGTVLYEEEHSTISTNDFGLFNLVIGRGSRTGGTAANFAGIDWSSGNRFLKVEVDAGSGFENLGTTQLLSVPYALYAKTSGNASSNLRGGDGITIRNDSVINDGDLSETNELITSFSIEAGNVLRITEASTNYDVDLTPLLPSSTDDQNLSFNSTGDSILIDGGDGIEIQFILDDIAANAQGIIDSTSNIRAALIDSAGDLRALIATGTDNQNMRTANDSILIDRGTGVDIAFLATDTKVSADSALLANRISTNETDISNNAQGIVDSTMNIRSALVDSAGDLRALFATGTDNQNLRTVNDSILIDRGVGIDIQFLATDAKVSADSALLVARISTNETNISNNAQGIIDSTLDIRAALVDSAGDLRALFATGTDDQNLTFRNDSILIENGDGIDFSPIITDISDNAADIITNQNEIAVLITDLNDLETRHLNDSAQTAQNQDSIGILTNLITSDNDADSTNELIDSIRFVGRTLEIYQQGSAQSISFDTLFDSRRLNIFNRTIQNRDSIRILTTLIGNDNDTSASNEIQQLSLLADQLRIDDPSGVTNPMPIDLSIYNTPEDSTRIANGTSRVFIPTANDSISFVAGGNEALRIDNNGRSYFRQPVGIRTPSPSAQLEVLSDNEGLAQQITAIGGDGPGEALRIDVDNGGNTSGTALESFSTGDARSIGIRTYANTSSLTDSSIALFAAASGTQNVYSGFFKNGDVYIGDNLILPSGAASGSVLTSDATGLASWQTPSSMGSGNPGEITFFTADDSLRSSSNLFWDEANDRLGIGMNTPAAKLCIWDTLFNSETTLNLRTYADNTFSGNNVYSINSYVDSDFGTFVDTAFGLNTRITGNSDYKIGVRSYVYGVPTQQKYYAFYGVANGSQEAYGLYTKAINGGLVNWSAYLDTGNVYIEDTLILNRTFKLSTGAANGNVLISDADGVASWQSAAGFGNVFTAGSNTAGRVAYWNNTDSLTFYDDLFIDEANNRVGIGTTSPTQKLQVNGGIRVSAGFNANNGTAGSPSYRFESDANTGMFLGASDQLGFSSGGTETMRIIANGNVGIGTSIPDSLLEVTGGAKVGALNINGAYTLPTTDGIGQQFLQTDGSGNVNWSSTLPTTTCPTGMTNVQGNICIETNERAASDWFDAANTCVSLGYKLPTWAEWYGAVSNAALTNETNNWEWVSDGTSNTARKVGNAGVKNTANDDPETGSANFRCIFYK